MKIIENSHYMNEIDKFVKMLKDRSVEPEDKQGSTTVGETRTPQVHRPKKKLQRGYPEMMH